VSDPAITLFGYWARVATEIEILIHFRLCSLPDVLSGLGDGYFEKMSDGSRARWLRSIAEAQDADVAVGERLQSVLNQVAEVRNHLGHAPFNLQMMVPEIKVGASKWIAKDLPTDSEIASAQARLEWVESWETWLIVQHAGSNAKQFIDDQWIDFKPGRPSPLLPS
jgi:hypothetical protein